MMKSDLRRPNPRPRMRLPLSRKPFGALRASGWTAGVLLLAAGCRTTVPGKAAPHSSTLDGRATYEAVLEPSSSVSKMVAQRDYIPAAPAGDSPPPAYPEQLIKLNLPPQKVVVRIFLPRMGHQSVRMSAIWPCSSRRGACSRRDLDLPLFEQCAGGAGKFCGGFLVVGERGDFGLSSTGQVVLPRQHEEVGG